MKAKNTPAGIVKTYGRYSHMIAVTPGVLTNGTKEDIEELLKKGVRVISNELANKASHAYRGSKFIPNKRLNFNY